MFDRKYIFWLCAGWEASEGSCFNSWHIYAAADRVSDRMSKLTHANINANLASYEELLIASIHQ